MKAPDILEKGAETYRERNKSYGDSYYKFGAVMNALFPEGITIVDKGYSQQGSNREWNRLGILVQVVSKLTRYSNDFHNPEEDSAHDLMVYAAMLQEVDE